MERELQRIVESLEDVVCSITADGLKVVYMNSAAYSLLGHSAKEFIDDPGLLLEIIHSEDRGRAETALREICQTASCDIEFRVCLPEGKNRWVRARCTACAEESVSCVLRDISEHKTTEEEHRQQAELQKTVASLSRKFINACSENLDAEINCALEVLAGFVGAERCFLLSYGENSIYRLREWCADGIAPHLENLLKLPNGSFPWWRQRVRCVGSVNVGDIALMPPCAKHEMKALQSQGIQSVAAVPLSWGLDFSGFLGVNSVSRKRYWNQRDMSLLATAAEIIGNAINRVRAEEDLHASEERLRTFYEQSPIGIGLFDTQGWLVHLNPASLNIFGIACVKDAEGLNLFENPDLPCAAKAALFQGEQVCFEREFDFDSARQKNLLPTSKKGTIHIDCILTPLGNPKDLTPGFMAQVQDVTEKKAAEKKLRESEERYRHFVEDFQGIAFRLDSEGRFVFLHGKVDEITGYSSEELVSGAKRWDEITVDGREERPTNFNETSEMAKSQEFQILHRDGGLRWIREYGHLVRDSRGQVAYVDGVAFDITAQKELESELHAEKERLQTMFQMSPIATIVLDPEGRVKMWSSAAEKTFGWTAEEVVGKMYPLAPEGCMDDFLAGLTATVQGRSRSGVEVLRCKKDHSQVWVRVSNGPLRDVNGKVVGIMCLNEDITESREMERALKENEERFRLLAENARDLVYRLRLFPEQRFEYVSPSAEHISGYTPDDFYKDPCLHLKIINNEDRKAFYALNAPADLDAGPVEVRLRRKDGENVWVELHNTVIYGDFGELVAVEGIARNITSRKDLEIKLKQMNTHDALTGLYNRAFFEEEMARADRERSESLGIIVIDVDGLKLINDTFGHDAGDAHLRLAAEIIKKSFREEDVVARIGGDEFAALLRNVDLDALKAKSEEIETGADSYSNDDKKGIPFSMTVGFSLSEGPEHNGTSLFKAADNDLYRKKLHHGQSAKSAVVNTLMKALEARDFVTEGHAERMQGLAAKMAEVLGMSESQAADLRLLAQFHDIGKVGVPDRLLFKAGPFTREEFEEMKRHAEIGYRIAVASPDLAPIADHILKHHEWWNGQGYPLGLKGEEIPLESRLIAVLDAYDAMTSDRPYRSAMPHHEAIEELTICAGSQFDPGIVEKFCAAIEGNVIPKKLLSGHKSKGGEKSTA